MDILPLAWRGITVDSYKDHCLTGCAEGALRMPFTNTGALMLTLQGEIAFASTYFCDLMGIEHDEVAGTSLFDFMFPEDMDAALQLLDASRLPHTNPIRIRLRRLDGTEVWTDFQANVLPARGGEIYAVTATVTAANGKH